MARELERVTSLREPGSYHKGSPLHERSTLERVMEEERRPLCTNGHASSVGRSQGEEDQRQRASSTTSRPTATRRTRVTINCEPEYQRRTKRRFTQSGYSVNSLTYEGTSSGEFVNIEGSDVTTEALELCEKWALKHYRRILMVLGWMPLRLDSLSPVTKRALHVILVLFWTVVILGAFIAQIISCFRRDEFLAFPDSDTWKTHNNHTALYCDRHVLTTFIIFDILLLSVYLYGVYLFRTEDEELSHLHNLASRAFVKNSLASERSNKWLLAIIMLFCIMGCSWILASFVIRILTVVCAHLLKDDVIIQWDDRVFAGGQKIALIVFSLVGFIFFDTVYMATTLNYTVQSEMIIWLLRAVTALLERNDYPSIDAAIKDVLECRRYLRVLNGRASTAVALLLFIFGNMAMLAIISLNNTEIDYDDDQDFKRAVAILNILLWLSIIALPIIQATRVTYACQLLKDSATEMRSRPQLYADTPQLDLDSFLILTQAIRLRATLFGVPVYPSLVYGVLAIATFVIILLIQTDIYKFSLLF